ncbi:hypothetical protein M569_01934 [Genlisea aurea]|uniref:S-protein homolog n=1 Tax=Genlisea aurea TaxID=192259 RepID=S8D5Y6_9LAMI|nr:hypothetical protein M569_01934 [Genlisea aurea]
MSSNLSLMLLSVFIGFNAVQACILEPRIDVFVKRNVSSNALPVRVHCFSGNDELGYHDLYKDEIFHWDFCLNFIPNTEFFCKVWWGAKVGAFTAYKQKAFLNKDTTIWLVKDDGIYLGHSPRFDDAKKMYKVTEEFGRQEIVEAKLPVKTFVMFGKRMISEIVVPGKTMHFQRVIVQDNLSDDRDGCLGAKKTTLENGEGIFLDEVTHGAIINGVFRHGRPRSGSRIAIGKAENWDIK